MMFAFIALTIAQATPVEALPVDRVMADYEAAMPQLAGVDAQIEAELARLGAAEPGWSTSGLSLAAAISAQHGDPEQHVLGEWVRGGRDVLAPGDRPLAMPQTMRRYSVRDYGGQIDYHYYHRLSSGIVLHAFGSERLIGNAACTGSEGIELISHQAWQDWSADDAFVAFGLARGTRDLRRTLCSIYRPTGDGRFLSLAYTPEGQPSLLVNEDPEVFTVTGRAEAAARIFDPDVPPPARE